MFVPFAFRRRLIPLVLASVLIVSQLGCASTTPRKAWWQFWRPKKVKTTEDMMPLSYEIPNPTGDGLGGVSIEPISEDGLGRYDEYTDEAYARLMDQPMNEPLREPATPEVRLQPVHFEFDQFDLSAAAQATLESNLEWMRRHPDRQVQIEGHCDERGTLEYNLLLGERRAKAVKAYLVSRGVPADQLDTISYGEERPVESGRTETAFARNRRAQFLAY